jgi:hypothetical protein
MTGQDMMRKFFLFILFQNVRIVVIGSIINA